MALGLLKSLEAHRRQQIPIRIEPVEVPGQGMNIVDR